MLGFPDDSCDVSTELTCICGVPPAGFHRDAEEEAGLLEAADAEAAAPFPQESHVGHAHVPPERVRETSSHTLTHTATHTHTHTHTQWEPLPTSAP